MKVRVIHPFHDINRYSLVHQPGESLDVEECRAKRLLELGLAVLTNDEVKSSSESPSSSDTAVEPEPTVQTPRRTRKPKMPDTAPGTEE